jgi:hypothetical protein
LNQISGFKIVNMSVGFNPRLDDSIANNVKNAVSDNAASLFVAAAGNRGGNLESDTFALYPANLGGTGHPNVVTVASIDGPDQSIQRLSAFTNRSAAYVDIAAPGCGLSSWLDADRAPAEISGTSQATPIVSFGAALLKSLWRTASPEQLKNRVLYSGDLLDAESDRRVVRSMSQLNIGKLLTYRWDRVTFTKEGKRRTVFGRVSALQDLKCDGGIDVNPSSLKSLKRTNEGTVMFSVNATQSLRVCWAALDLAVAVSLQAEKELRDGKIENIGPEKIDLVVSDINELIKSR